jgi:hypothetical protein
MPIQFLQYEAAGRERRPACLNNVGILEILAMKAPRVYHDND